MQPSAGQRSAWLLQADMCVCKSECKCGETVEPRMPASTPHLKNTRLDYIICANRCVFHNPLSVTTLEPILKLHICSTRAEDASPVEPGVRPLNATPESNPVPLPARCLPQVAFSSANLHVKKLGNMISASSHRPLSSLADFPFPNLRNVVVYTRPAARACQNPPFLDFRFVTLPHEETRPPLL